jgi:hypothetical protein
MSRLIPPCEWQTASPAASTATTGRVATAGVAAFGRSSIPQRRALVEKVLAVAQRLLCVLIDRNGDRLNMLEAIALTRGALAQFGERVDPWRVVRLVVVPFELLTHQQVSLAPDDTPVIPWVPRRSAALRVPDRAELDRLADQHRQRELSTTRSSIAALFLSTR